MKRLLCLLLTLCCMLPFAACAGPNPPLEPTDSTTASSPEDTTLPDDTDVTTEPNDSDSESDSDVTTEPPVIDPVTGDNFVDLDGYVYMAYVYVRAGSSASTVRTSG
ncbi:MAG: hypothetical protein IJX80_10325 [Clostridia bacterium]|nr:hypothetical protein [Clostridia bacterium]